MVEAVEYPVGRFPQWYQRFRLWGDTITLLGNEVPDGSNAYIYYGAVHTLDTSSSTISGNLEDLVATGACGYAAIELAAYAINRVNVGGTMTPGEFRLWGSERLALFKESLNRLGRRHRVRSQQLFEPEG
jgi:hypothetical protein